MLFTRRQESSYYVIIAAFAFVFAFAFACLRLRLRRGFVAAVGVKDVTRCCSLGNPVERFDRRRQMTK